MEHLKADQAVYEAIQKELGRQRDKLEMIASENIVSYAVMEAQGSVLTNKYAEGYPGKRYYGGCEYVDIVEQLAIDRAKELFGAEHVNVQPHSGSQANFAVYYGLLNPGDTVMGMNLTDGGHLTHGSTVNISGNYFNFVPYGVRKEDELLDYEAMEKIAKEVQPKLIIGGTSAYSRIIDFERIAAIAKEVGALLWQNGNETYFRETELAFLIRLFTGYLQLYPTHKTFACSAAPARHRAGAFSFKRRVLFFNHNTAPGALFGPGRFRAISSRRWRMPRHGHPCCASRGISPTPSSTTLGR